MKKLLAVAAVLLAQGAHAAVFDFAGLADKKTSIDGYIASLAGEKGWASFSWTVDGLTVTANAYTIKKGVEKLAYAYLDSGKAGLGVCKAIYAKGKDKGECTPSSDDNVQSGEYLELTFSKEVSLDHISFVNGDHKNTFASSAKFGLSVDDGSFASKTLKHSFDPLNLTGTSFVFKGLGTGVNKEFYINTLTATAAVVPVPEPETYALMGLGLLAIVAKRRSKASA